MSVAVGVVSVLLGVVYTSYGILTVLDLARGWRTSGFSHFATAWILMAFTCGPHHLDHGLHVLLSGRPGGGLELLAVLVGLPFGAIWFLLRLEAVAGGRGDRLIVGTPSWVRALPFVMAGYGVVAVAAGVLLAMRAEVFAASMLAQAWLAILYFGVGYYLLRGQLLNHGASGTWSLSGLALTHVFPTCAVMHLAWMGYAAAGVYDLDVHGRIFDWLGVPASAYFLWVVRSLYFGMIRDWNRAALDVMPGGEAAPAERVAVPA